MCRFPYHFDSEVASIEKSTKGTISVYKRFFLMNGIIKKYYIPAYHRFGYPLISFSQLKKVSHPNINLERTLNDDKIIAPFTMMDDHNAFVLAFHTNEDDFKRLTELLSSDWKHTCLSINNPIHVVNFDYINIINRKFFRHDYDIMPIKIQKSDRYKFYNKKMETVFRGLISNPNQSNRKKAWDIFVHRQSISSTLRRFRKEEILEKNVVVDLTKIKMRFAVVIHFNRPSCSREFILTINKILKPFYYWIFNDEHFIIRGFVNRGEYRDSIRKTKRQKGISNVSMQLFDVPKSTFHYQFDSLNFLN